MLKYNNFLITGGAGFIGSHLCDKLISLNKNVLCLDLFDDYYNPTIKRENIKSLIQIPSFKLIEGDIRDKQLLNRIFSNHKIDIVLHFAARAGVRPSINLPELYFDVNVNGTITLLETMLKHHISNLIFASSSSVYGNNTKIPFSEDDILDKPISPYAASKRAGELICYTYHYLYSFNIFCLRFFTVYGPRQRPEMAINKFFSNIIESKKITLFGNGELQRDYTFIDDIIDGIIKSIENLKGYEIINLGESKTVSLLKLIELMEKIANKKAIIELSSTPPGDVLLTYANIDKAKKILNYQPKYSLEKGLDIFYKWKTKEK